MVEIVQTFITGGILCVIAQIIMDKSKLTPAHVLVLAVSSGVVLSAIGIYDYIVEFGGYGATIPLPGFGHALAQGAINHTKTQGLIGALSGGIKNTSVGITVAIIIGYLIAVMFNPKSKK